MGTVLVPVDGQAAWVLVDQAYAKALFPKPAIMLGM
jgi:hypothetical protein